MVEVTQADVEAYKAMFGFTDDTLDPVGDDRGPLLILARHRIAALEEAAKVAEQTDTGWMDARTFTAQKIATSIRALKGPSNA
jgi:hypothetical protein